MGTVPEQLAPGLWRWTARHPEWHPGRFGAEVASFALVAAEDLLLIDPILADVETPVLDVLDRLARGHDVHVLITIGYHVRDGEQLRARYDGWLWGPPNCASRLEEPERLETLDPQTEGPGGAVAFRIGKPVRGERPLWLPSHRAVAFGDAVVSTPDGALRLWAQERVDERRRRFYRDRFAPTLAPLLDLPVERVLVTHGAPILTGGAVALRRALEEPPWEHRG